MFESERDRMRRVDWQDSDLYEAYIESREMREPIAQALQRFASLKTVHAVKMYTDVELQYFIKLI